MVRIQRVGNTDLRHLGEDFGIHITVERGPPEPRRSRRRSSAPYRGFILEEQSRLKRVAAGLDEVSGRLAALESVLEEAAPTGHSRASARL